MLGGDGGNEGVSGKGGEIDEKGSEAVDREAVVGFSGSLLGDGGGGGLGDNAGALRFPLHPSDAVSIHPVSSNAPPPPQSAPRLRMSE